MESQVEQTLARGWALRPEPGWAADSVKEQTGEVEALLGLLVRMELVDGMVATSKAGQLVKATQSTKARMGFRGGEAAAVGVTVRAWLAGLVTPRVDAGAGHLAAWLGELEASQAAGRRARLAAER